MAYFDFPHTDNYDSDLGFLIKAYKELLVKVQELDERVTALEQKKANNGLL